ncbi:MAG: hypothetical protein RLZZ71_2021 [Bacteroidota bacterium]|jgi:hypothetical protein
MYFNKLLVALLVLVSVTAKAQTLTLSSSGETGTSGANWSSSGSNPVVISATGNANVNTSVIESYLNSGISVTVQCIVSNGEVVVGSPLTKISGGDATLSFRADKRFTSTVAITSSSSKLNLVLWSDYNNSNVGGVGVSGSITTNGGHFWAGGSSTSGGSYTWNGLTVGNGPSVGSSSANHYAMDFFATSVTTGGGDILLWAGTGNGSTLDGIGLQNNPQLNAGSGNVTLITRQFINTSNTLSVTSTGKLTLATDSSNPWTSDFNWATTTSGPNVTLTSALGQPLQINNFSSLGGLSLGVYDGYGSSFNYTNSQNVNINSSINIPGPINVFGGAINLGTGVEVFASTANGSLNFQGKGGFSTIATSGSTRGKLMTTGGGDITINADADNNNSGTLDIDWLTIDGGTGDILLESSALSWNTSAQVTLPEFYSNSGTLTIRNVSSSSHAFSTNWIAMFGTYSGITFGRDGSTESILFTPCTVCDISALNYGSTAFQIAGPISGFGGSINVNMNLTSTIFGADILLKSAKTIIVEENKTIRTNNGDITFWSNSDGIANSTDGDFIGLNQGVTLNSANGLTNQTSGGGTITIAGGTTSQTLASGTVVPTGYAYSNRTAVWGDHAPSAVTFGRYAATATYINSLNIYSGGGDVVIKGQSANAVPGFAWYRGFTGATQNINSGAGTITIIGDNTSTGHGIELSYYNSTSVGPTITSSNTTNSAITVTGATSSTGTVAGYQGSATFVADAAGGGISISGQTANVSTYGAIEASALYAYALSGPITLIANGGTGLKTGGVLGKGTLPSSSSNITLRSNSFGLYNSETLQTTGTLTVEPLGTSFASSLTFPMTNLTVPNTLTGLTVGKSGNTADITLSTSQSVAGPISVYGGTITQSAAYTTTVNTGHINFIGTGSVLMSANISTSGGSLVVWSDKDGNADGRVSFPSSVTTSGGNIYVGGGSSSETVSGLTVPTGYSASSNASFNGIALFSTTVNSGGGAIRMKGTVNAVDGSNAGIQVHGSTSISSGAGALSLYGQRTGNPHMSAGLFIGTTIDLSTSTGNVSISSTTGDIYLEGTSASITSGYSWCHGLAIVEYAGDDVTISSTTGNINLTGNATSAALQAGEAVGFVIQSSSTASLTRINTDGGALEINGISGNTAGDFGASYRAQNVSGNISFGDANTGDVTLRFGSLSTSNAANTGTISIQNLGNCVFEGVSGAPFASAVSITSEFSIASTATSLRVGSTTNNQNVTLAPAVSVAGPITVYGGTIEVNQNLTSTLSGSAILLQATGAVSLAASRTIQSNTGNITVRSNSAGAVLSAASSVILNSGSTLNSQGGNITIGGNYTGVQGSGLYAVSSNSPAVLINGATITAAGGNIKIYGKCSGSYDDGIRLVGTLNTTGAGNIELYGEAHGGNNGTDYFGGITFGSSAGSTVETENGNLILNGYLTNTQSNSTGAINFYRNNGSTGQTRHINLLSKTGNVTVTADNGTTGAYGIGHSSWGNVYVGSPASGWTATGNVEFNYPRLVNAGYNGIRVKTTGAVTYQPIGSSFSLAQVFPANSYYVLADGASSLTIGKSSNTANIEIASALSIAGPIAVYGGLLEIDDDIASTAGGNITLSGSNGFYTSGSSAIQRDITTSGGNILVEADSDSNGSGVLNLDYMLMNAGSGTTTIRGELMTFNTGNDTERPWISGTGIATIESNDTDFGQEIHLEWFKLATGLGGLNFGKTTNTRNMYFNSAAALSFVGPVNVTGAAIAFSTALTVTNDNLSVKASGAVTQTASISAIGISLSGAGSFTLSNTSNNFGTLAAGTSSSRIGALSLTDASGGLTIGTVGSISGIYSSGLVSVETLTGNISLTQPVSTTNTTSSALIINSGKSSAIDASEGGDIIVTGSPTITVGTGGIAKLFSGMESNSTGLTTLVGGSSNVRTGYDETSSSFSPTLSANNAYAIYRALEGEGDITIVTSGGHAEGTSWTYSNGVISTLTSPILINASDVVTKLADSDLSIEARTITFSANIISSTPKNLKVLAKRHIVNSVATTITTQGGDVLLSSNVDDATDGESTNNGRIDFRYGLTITTNGGDITLAGGNTLGTGYALGQSGGLNPEGVRIDVTANLNSGNGNISIKGKSYSGAIGGGTGGSGVGFYYLTSNGNINSGSGSIVLDGYSQTSGSTFSSGIVFYNTTANLPFTIRSSSSSASAITINAFSTGTSQDAFGIETEAYSILNILAPSGGGIDINTGNSVSNYYDIVFRAETNILSTGGPINLHGGQFGGASNGYLYIAGNLFLGSKSGVVSSSTSDITIAFDRFNFNSLTPKIATTGAVVIESIASSFGHAVYTSDFALNQNSQTMSSFRLGKTGSEADLYVNSAFTVAGPISVYGWNVDVTGNITSSADGDIFIKGISDWNDVEMTSTIAKTAGTGTLTIQANGRANFSGPITASGTGVLNVVLWSDYNGDNGDGGATFSGAVTTNGGHVWMGGSNSNGGSYTWNGLTVGDGPSVGGSNANALDFFNSVTTNGGDVFAWAGNGNGGVNGIASNGSWTVNAGSGDITFVSSVTSGTIGFTTTGSISLLPNGGSYASALTIGGTTTSDVFTINTGHYNGLKINNLSTYGGLTIGSFSGFSGVTLSNSSDVTISSNLSAAGPISLYGGIVTLNANLTTTNNGDISIYSDSPIGGLSSQRNVTASGTFKYISNSDSFNASVTFPIANLNLSSAGLQIGKSTNTSAVTLASNTSAAGPVSIYGGAVTLTGGLTTTSTSTGDVTIKSSNLTGSGGLTVATGRVLTLNLSSTSSLPGTLTGTDIQFVKDGVGTLTLSNAYTFGGQSSVLGGTLRTNDITFSNLSVSSGANYILSSDKEITISGALVNNGSFKLENGATMLQTSATANTGTGTYTAERTMPGTGTSAPTGRFWYTGVPMTGATSGGFVAQGANKLWSHSEATGAYSEIDNSITALDQGRGYVFRGIDNTALNANTYAFTSTNIGNGSVTYNLTRTASAPKPGFNLIANPYPSHVSWDQLYNSTVSNNASPLLPTVWYRTASGSTMLFDTYNATIGVGTNNSGTSGNGTQVTGTIAPFQSFWVRLNTGTSLSMTATNAMRSHGTQSTLTLTPATVRLNISNGVLHDETLVVLNEDLSNSYDNNDSSKEIPSATIHQLYSLEGANKVAINGIGNALTKDTLQLGVQIPTAGTYSINCTEHTFSDIVYLEDKLTDEYIELSNPTTYSFTSEAGTFNSRFVLHFAPAPALPGQTPATAIAMSTSNWPQCNNVTSEDTWHAFTATTEGISIAVNTASADVIIQLQDANGNAVAQENAVNGIGNETLNFFGLTAGQIYKVGVLNNISGQPTGTYGICVKSLKRGGCDYGTGPYSLCQYYKATWAGSTGVSYTFTFTGTSGPAAGQTFTRTQNSDICVLSTVTPLLPYGSTYGVVISNTYTLTDGAGNTEQITVPSINGCQVITIAEPQTALSNNSSCNNGARFRGAVVSSMPWVCGASNWRWRFTEVNPLTLQPVGLPVELNRGAASNFISLGNINQLQSGKTYAVRTAPVFTYTGSNYNWGPTQYLCIVGTAGMAVEGTDEEQGSTKDALQDASQVNTLVYVTEGNQLNIQLANAASNTAKRGDIYDVTGRLVKSVRLVEGMNQVELSEASGIYVVRVVRGSRLETHRVFIKK